MSSKPVDKNLWRNFQWQKVRHEYFGPGFSSMSPQQDSRFWMKNNKHTVISTILRKRWRKDVGMLINDWKLDKDY